MDDMDEHAAVEQARVRVGLTVQQLWLRYLALGGSCDAFDVDGYLQGMVSLAVHQQDVLAQAVNEALDELVDGLRVPLSTGATAVEGESVQDVVRRMLAAQPPAPGLDAPAQDEGGGAPVV